MLFTDLPVLMLAQTMFRSMDNFSLVVVLFFILCGNIMTSGSIVDKLIKVANVFVGALPGGLGMAGVLACGLFGAISGSTVATVVAIGGFMIPALLENGYDESYAMGIMTTAPNLGVIIPPSISMILYCMISNVSLEGLFLTGFLPGVLIILFTCIYSYFVYRKRTTFVRKPKPTWADLKAAFREGLLVADAARDHFRRHFFRSLYRQRSRGGGQPVRVYRRTVHPQGHETERRETDHRQLGGDLGHPADHRGRAPPVSAAI